ncbi:aspartate/glutamate racemase family protein [Companilactobacillus pabuli]|jgi:aspartate racemase|uniref:Aspartate/glutamate racemase family protein n=1 Tax=Companilactobacillus pabuli TaxID=2714036 RepID=A0A7L7KYZ5_9LACO|nr:amino acid racemase [Companilactobacillus pabuli]AKP02820.1 aspartate racemase [Companilactobacillus farciminis]AKS51118.1 aspartate racemase [Companilactobacillus farciminis]MDG5114271.1 amino acid racemase [Companilactobacillus pabuli]QMT85003.1 aspartate/glutamate racemase family protein [Companilactobacillus pabuli]
MKKFFTVIGGMGSLATESYVHLLNEKTPTKKDQDYLDYILVNHSTVPDRTAHILDHSKPSFLPPLAEDIKQQSLLKPEFMVIICNTAHYYYKELQAVTDIPIIHMPHMAISMIEKKYPKAKKVGLIATKGTIADHVYENEIKDAGYEYSLGDQSVQDEVESLIYDDIKVKGAVNAPKFHHILQTMHDKFDCDVIVLGCTELSLAQEKAPDHPYQVIDSQEVIVDKSIEFGEKIRRGEKIDFDKIY